MWKSSASFKLDKLVSRRRHACEKPKLWADGCIRVPGFEHGYYADWEPLLISEESVSVRVLAKSVRTRASIWQWTSGRGARPGSLYLCFRWAVAALHVGATKAVLLVPVCVGGCVRVLLVHLSRIHPQTCYWPNLQMGTAAATSIGLGWTDLCLARLP